MATPRSSLNLLVRAATVGCALVILASSLIPKGAGVPIPGGGWDKVWHTVGFAVQAALLLLSFRGADVVRRKAVGLTLAMVTGYGILTEGLQAFVPGRFVSGQDLLADVLGAVLGAGAVALLPWKDTHDGPTADPADQ